MTPKLGRYLNQFRDVKPQTIIITGANSGLGYSATKHFLHLGMTVIMACRNLTKANEAREELLKLYPNGKIIVLPYDQADFVSIDRFVREIATNYPHFDSLILNAGIYHPIKGLVTMNC